MTCRAVSTDLPSVTNALALLRLLPLSDRDKDAEILALRHQIAVLQRQLHGGKVRFTATDRALLAALLHGLPRQVLHRLRMLVHPETVLRWHRDLIRRRHAAISRPKRAGRPPTVRSIRTLVLRLARENDSWGHRRIHGELLVLGIRVAVSTVWEILREAGIDPAPQRTSQTWATFLRSQAQAIIAADFIETVTLTGARFYVLASSSTPPAGSVSSAPPPTRPQSGLPKPPVTSPWTYKTPAARSCT
jgi:putative transposase